ncbi:MAG TPA: META domain-containing protein [Methanomicrobiales archaeon]|nr:META domain-containing protein [Methanomicrobiales archaeon]
MPRALAALLIAAAVLLAGCASTGPSSSPGGDLVGTSWVLASMVDAGGNLTAVPAQTPMTLEFRDSSTLGGSAGCNQYGASYATNGIRVNITRIASTLRYCTDTGVDSRETTFLGILPRVRYFRVDGDSLRFFDAGGGDLLAFVRAASGSAQLTAGKWVLDSMASGTGGVTSVLVGTQVDAAFASDGTLSGSGGCNLYFGRYTVSGTSLSVGAVVATKKSCATPAGIMDQEQAFLSDLGRVAGYSIDGNELVLSDAGGNTLLSFQPGPGS